MSKLSEFSTCSSFKLILHLMNERQFLKATFEFAAPPTTVISPVTKIYASA